MRRAQLLIGIPLGKSGGSEFRLRRYGEELIMCGDAHGLCLTVDDGDSRAGISISVEDAKLACEYLAGWLAMESAVRRAASEAEAPAQGSEGR